MGEVVKVVITLNSEKTMIGVQKTDCDPVFVTVEGGLEVALERVPALVEEAKARWQTDPKYPKADLPEPPPPAPSPRPAQATPAKPAPAPQQRLF